MRLVLLKDNFSLKIIFLKIMRTNNTVLEQTVKQFIVYSKLGCRFLCVRGYRTPAEEQSATLVQLID